MNSINKDLCSANYQTAVNNCFGLSCTLCLFMSPIEYAPLLSVSQWKVRDQFQLVGISWDDFTSAIPWDTHRYL